MCAHACVNVCDILHLYCIHVHVGVMSDDQKKWFIQFYQKLVQYTRPVTASPSIPHRPVSSTQRQLEAAEDKVQVECRRLSAYNFPVSIHV